MSGVRGVTIEGDGVVALAERLRNSRDGGIDDGAADVLKSIVSRIENLNSQKDDIAHQISGEYKFAKAKGFDPRILKEVIRRRALLREEREGHDALLHQYELALEA